MTRVHIHAPKGHYIGQVRLYGHRKWQQVGNGHDSAEAAMAAAVLRMTPEHHRARVLFLTEWYEPTIVMECHR